MALHLISLGHAGWIVEQPAGGDDRTAKNCSWTYICIPGHASICGGIPLFDQIDTAKYVSMDAYISISFQSYGIPYTKRNHLILTSAC